VITRPAPVDAGPLRDTGRPKPSPGIAEMIAIISVAPANALGRPRPIGAGYPVKLASTAAPFCIRFASAAALPARPKVPLTRDGHYRGGMP